MNTNPNSEEAERNLLSRAEFAQASGLSLATVDRYLRDGRLQKVQIGGQRARVLIPRSQLFPMTSPSDHQTNSETFSHRSAVRRGPMPRWKRN